MCQHIIVPVDASDRSWRATVVADRLAAALDADVEVLHVEALPWEPARDRLLARLARTPWIGAPPTISFVSEARGIARAIADHVAGVEGSLVLASTGRDRADVVLGGVTTELLAATGRPVVVVGPEADVEGPEWGSELLVTVDLSLIHI